MERFSRRTMAMIDFFWLVFRPGVPVGCADPFSLSEMPLHPFRAFWRDRFPLRGAIKQFLHDLIGEREPRYLVQYMCYRLFDERDDSTRDALLAAWRERQKTLLMKKGFTEHEAAVIAGRYGEDSRCAHASREFGEWIISARRGVSLHSISPSRARELLAGNGV